jgi:hypothetical protein
MQNKSDTQAEAVREADLRRQQQIEDLMALMPIFDALRQQGVLFLVRGTRVPIPANTRLAASIRSMATPSLVMSLSNSDKLVIRMEAHRLSDSAAAHKYDVRVISGPTKKAGQKFYAIENLARYIIPIIANYAVNAVPETPETDYDPPPQREPVAPEENEASQNKSDRTRIIDLG